MNKLVLTAICASAIGPFTLVEGSKAWGRVLTFETPIDDADDALWESRLYRGEGSVVHEGDAELSNDSNKERRKYIGGVLRITLKSKRYKALLCYTPDFKTYATVVFTGTNWEKLFKKNVKDNNFPALETTMLEWCGLVDPGSFSPDERPVWKSTKEAAAAAVENKYRVVVNQHEIKVRQLGWATCPDISLNTLGGLINDLEATVRSLIGHIQRPPCWEVSEGTSSGSPGLSHPKIHSQSCRFETGIRREFSTWRNDLPKAEADRLCQQTLLYLDQEGNELLREYIFGSMSVIGAIRSRHTDGTLLDHPSRATNEKPIPQITKVGSGWEIPLGDAKVVVNGEHVDLSAGHHCELNFRVPIRTEEDSLESFAETLEEHVQALSIPCEYKDLLDLELSPEVAEIDGSAEAEVVVHKKENPTEYVIADVLETRKVKIGYSCTQGVDSSFIYSASDTRTTRYDVFSSRGPVDMSKHPPHKDTVTDEDRRAGKLIARRYCAKGREFDSVIRAAKSSFSH
jgi:hypothetical protein